MVVATHRHADHISGFGGKPGEVIASLEPELVVQPWTEDPDARPRGDGRRTGGSGAQQRREPDARRAPRRHAGRRRKRSSSEVPRLEGIAGVPQDRRPSRSQFLGETNIKNEAAVQNLMAMGKRQPVYARFGTKLPIASVLPGVASTCSGPPTLEQSQDDRDAGAHGPGRVLAPRRRAARQPRPARASRLRRSSRTAATRARPAGGALGDSADRPHARRGDAGDRASLDGVLNNTSLILLFEVGGSRLLFPGDAQIENWSYALFDAPSAASRSASGSPTPLLQGRPPRQPQRDAEDAVERVRAREARPRARTGWSRWSRPRRQARRRSPAAPRCRAKPLVDALEREERPPRHAEAREPGRRSGTTSSSTSERALRRVRIVTVRAAALGKRDDRVADRGRRRCRRTGRRNG